MTQMMMEMTMVNEMYLDHDNLVKIIEFLDKFKTDTDVVKLTCDSSSGIGSTIIATVQNVTINEEIVDVSKVIASEENW